MHVPNINKKANIWPWI